MVVPKFQHSDGLTGMDLIQQIAWTDVKTSSVVGFSQLLHAENVI